MKQEIQKKYVELQLLNQHIKQVQEQFVFLQQQLNELMNLEISISELKEIKDESEIFSSLGSGIFINSKILNKEKVLVNIGSGILVEKNLIDAVQLIKNQSNVVSTSIENIREQLTKAMMYSEELSNELNQLSPE